MVGNGKNNIRKLILNFLLNIIILKLLSLLVRSDDELW